MFEKEEEDESIDVVWLKKDVRLHDHGPLRAASSSKRKFAIIYIYEPDQLSHHSVHGSHVHFANEGIVDLDKRIRKIAKRPNDFCITLASRPRRCSHFQNKQNKKNKEVASPRRNGPRKNRMRGIKRCGNFATQMAFTLKSLIKQGSRAASEIATILRKNLMLLWQSRSMQIFLQACSLRSFWMLLNSKASMLAFCHLMSSQSRFRQSMPATANSVSAVVRQSP